ncbi:outer membrane beta-barrel protein [Fibrivirga algicola]|uniref:Autotransporter outer membrane beta-barrel domain-containing protein n=1 Tax=Fibrivirga algicola TaxID=2950420 RepID=A0ABX0QK20_9BACT|nr:outer membrane beta-barrel protein [Fibrivirga algicola]NID12481.1 autotransporter outer membrane beta-barrel domain-containing protein [Fibrivirga algicola]
MKRLFVLIFVGLLGRPSVAQTQKGQSITSGNVNLSFDRGHLDSDKRVSYSAGFLINRGRFVRDNWLLGGTLGFSYGQTTYDNSNSSTSLKSTANSVSAGIFLRRYWPILDRLYVYAGGGLGSYQFKSNYTNNVTFGTSIRESSGASSNWQLNATGQLGALYTLTNRIAIEMGISNEFPTGLYNANFGVAILAGNKSTSIPVLPDFEAPQTRKGRWLLGVSANVTGTSTSQVNDERISSVQSSATTGVSAGNFVKDNLIAGVAINYSANRLGDADAPGAVNYSLAAVPFVRSYRGASRLRPFVEGRGEYGIIKSETNTVVGTRYVGAGISAGLAYMASERFIIQTTLGSLDGRYTWYPSAGGSEVYSNYTINATATTLSNISVAYSL